MFSSEQASKIKLNVNLSEQKIRSSETETHTQEQSNPSVCFIVPSKAPAGLSVVTAADRVRTPAEATERKSSPQHQIFHQMRRSLRLSDRPMTESVTKLKVAAFTYTHSS